MLVPVNTIPLKNLKFVRVCFLVGRYFCNMYTCVVKQIESVFFFMSRTIIIVPYLHNIRLSYTI